MGPIAFVSDIHLDGRDAAKAAEFARFLSDLSTRGVRDLFILGDLFHYWVGPRHLTEPDHRGACDAIAEAGRRGLAVRVMPGNRDFLIDPAFARRVGATFVPDARELAIDGRRVHLTHGDLLCRRDRAYLAMRAILQAPLTVAALRRLPLCVTLPLARGLRDYSAHRVREKAERERLITPSVVRRLVEEGVDVVIAGHVHRAGRARVATWRREGTLITLGSWDRGPTWLEYRDGRFEFQVLTAEAQRTRRVAEDAR